jgi:hypothetical protein
VEIGRPCFGRPLVEQPQEAAAALDQGGERGRLHEDIATPSKGSVMKFGIHDPSWLFGHEPCEIFEGVKAKAQWAEDWSGPLGPDGRATAI